MHLLEARLGRYVALALVLLTVSAVAVLRESPPRGRVVVTDTETEILDIVEFAPATATLQPRSFATLDAVAATLIANPSIELVEVQAHGRGIGDDAEILDLTDQRAHAVLAYLVATGVEAARLDAQGYGNTQPIDQAGSWKNERISFLILKRSSDLE